MPGPWIYACEHTSHFQRPGCPYCGAAPLPIRRVTPTVEALAAAVLRKAETWKEPPAELRSYAPESVKLWHRGIASNGLRKVTVVEHGRAPIRPPAGKRKLAHAERATWGTCQKCAATHGIACKSTFEELAQWELSRQPIPFTHERRLDAAPKTTVT